MYVISVSGEGATVHALEKNSKIEENYAKMKENAILQIERTLDILGTTYVT